MSTGTYLDHLEPELDELDFGAGFASSTAPLPERAAPQTHGVSAAAHVARTEYAYPGWACDCAKPVRHVRTAAGVAILPKSGDGVPVPCPTWRPATLVWRRPMRTWGKPVPTLEPIPADPAGPIDGPCPLEPADIPPRWSGKSLLPAATVAAWARGRMVDDGPVVTQIYLSGVTADGRCWRAVWTDGGFDGARLAGSAVNLAELRAVLKG